MEPDPKVAKFLAENKGQRQPQTAEINPRHKEEIRFIREATLCTVTTGVNPAQLTTVKKWLRHLPGNPHNLKDDDHNAFVHQDMKTLSKRGLIIAKGAATNAVYYLDPAAIGDAMKSADAKTKLVYKANIEKWTTLPNRKGY